MTRGSSKERPGTLETLRFTLEMLKRIPRTHKISAPQLHRELRNAGYERDLRTVQRQLDELSQHFDIERDERTKPFGYRWKEQAKGLSLPSLNERESLLLALAEQHLCNLLPATVHKTMQPFFEQARAKLAPHEDGSHAARAWMRKVRVVSTTQPLLPPQILPEVFDSVSTALYTDCWLDVSYRNSGGREVKGRVKPLGMAQQGTRLYLVCHFDGFEQERSLALNRIESATATNLPFDRPAGFDLAKFDGDGGFGYGTGRRIALELLIDKGAGLHLLESKLSADQTEVLEGDQYRIRATVVETEQLKWWLRGFGKAVRVVAPLSLAASL